MKKTKILIFGIFLTLTLPASASFFQGVRKAANKSLAYQGTRFFGYKANLLKAAKKGRRKELEKLLKQEGKDPSKVKTKMGRNPLHLASGSGHTASVALLRKTYPVNGVDNFWDTPLHRACERGRLGVVLELLKDEKTKINKPDDDEKTPLIVACFDGNYDVAATLIHAGADLDSMDINDNTPLSISLNNGHYDIAELLLNEGAAVQKNGPWGYGILHSAISAPLELLNRLVESGAAVEGTDCLGNTVLSEAIVCNQHATVKFLLSKGASLVKPNFFGETPLQKALSKNDPEMLLIIEPYAYKEIAEEIKESFLSKK